MFVICSLSADY